MNLRRELSGYWQLFVLMYFPARWVFILGAIGVSSAALGACLWLMLSLTSTGLSAAGGFYKFFLIVGMLIAAIPLIFGFFLLPIQSRSLCTSKQFMLLTNIRKKIFIIFATILIAYPIVLAVAYAFKESNDLSPERLFVLAFFCLSAILFFSIWMFGINPAFNIFIAVPFFLAVPAIKLLSLITTPAIFIGTILIWFSFSRWWFKWKPRKFTPNAFGNDVNLKKITQSTSQSQWVNSFTIQEKSNSWVFSRLMGQSDAALNIFFSDLLNILFVLAIWTAMSIPSFSDGKNLFETPIFKIFFGNLVFFWVFYFALSAIGMRSVIHKNLSLVWLTIQQPRDKLFNVIEKKFITLYFLKTIPITLLAILGLSFAKPTHEILISLLAIPLGIAFAYVYFYFDSIILTKIPSENVLNILLQIIKTLFPPFLIGWISSSSLKDNGAAGALPTLLIEFVILLTIGVILRYFAKQSISRIDFMGVQ